MLPSHSHLQIGDKYRSDQESVIVDLKLPKILILKDKQLSWVNENDLGIKIGISFKGFGKLYKCKSNYVPAKENELTLKINDIVQILDIEIEGFALGRIKQVVGFFPLNLMDPVDKQHYAISEYYQTQLDYIRDLQLIKDEFIVPSQQKKILNEKLIEVLFGNLLDILQLEQTILEEMETLKTNNNFDVVHICGMISKNVPKYFIYIPYGSNNQEQLKKLKDITQSHKIFKPFLDEKHKSNILRGLDLSSYLIKPVQRLCKLPLLLKEMRQAACLDLINATMIKVQFLINAVNEGARKPGSVVPSMLLADGLSDLKNENRVLLRTFECRVIVKGQKKNIKLFVFNDVLYMQPKDKKHTHTFHYEECEIGSVLDVENDSLCAVELQEEDRNKLFIIHFLNNGQKLDFMDVLKRLCLLQLGEYPMESIQKHFTVSKMSTTESDDSCYAALPFSIDPVDQDSNNALGLSRRKSVLKAITPVLPISPVSPVALLEIENQLVVGKLETEALKSEKNTSNKLILELQGQIEKLQHELHEKNQMSIDDSGVEIENRKLVEELKLKELSIAKLSRAVDVANLEIKNLAECSASLEIDLTKEKQRNVALAQQLNVLLDEDDEKNKILKELRNKYVESEEKILSLEQTIAIGSKDFKNINTQHKSGLDMISHLESTLEATLTEQSHLHDSLELEIKEKTELKLNMIKEISDKALAVEMLEQLKISNSKLGLENETLSRNIKLLSGLKSEHDVLVEKLAEKDMTLLTFEKEVSNSQLKNQHYQNEIHILNDLLTVLTKTNQERTDLKGVIEDKFEYMLLKQTQYATHSSSLLHQLSTDLAKVQHQNSFFSAHLSKYKFTTSLLLEWFGRSLGKSNSEKDELIKLVDYSCELVNQFADLKDEHMLLNEKFKLLQ